MKRALSVTYAALCYVVFFATFLYAVAFVGGFGVPHSLGGGRTAPLPEAIAVDAALLALFALQHSGMARPAFKRWWTRFVPRPIERSTYVLLASLALLLLFWQWRPLGGMVWSVTGEAPRDFLIGLSLFGWGIVLTSTFLTSHSDLFGLRQTWLYATGRPYTGLPFSARGLYRRVRHPLYLGFLIAFWTAPRMTFGHLLFALATTAYMLVAIRLEERDLTTVFGDAYRTYRKRVPMLVPRPWRHAAASPGEGRSQPFV